MADARAKTKRLQKRRKVFVNEYSDGLLLLATKLSRKEAVKGRCGLKALTVCFIEARPGDVVLSREDVKSFRGVCPIAYRHLRALLRGGR